MPIKGLITFIYAHDENSFLRQKEIVSDLLDSSPDIFWCNSKTTHRLACIAAHRNSWILFLDADCELTKASAAKVAALSQTAKTDSVIGGEYLNPSTATYLQKAHNFIANMWVRQTFALDSEHKHFLGGIFLLSPQSARPEINDVLAALPPLFWGAEDLWLAQQLSQQGITISFDSGLQVIHHTSKTWLHFIRRAYLQGVNHQIYIHKNSYGKVTAKYYFGFRQTFGAGLHLVPAIGLHFCIQKWAKLIQIIRQVSNLKSSK